MAAALIPSPLTARETYPPRPVCDPDVELCRELMNNVACFVGTAPRGVVKPVLDCIPDEWHSQAKDMVS